MSTATSAGDLSWARRYAPAAGRLARYAVLAVLSAYCLIGLVLVARQLSRLRLTPELGYGDSYIVYDVMRFQRTGTIYHDLSKPPYLATQYSPAVYLLYSIPGRLHSARNIFEGPRVVALLSFLACLAVVASLARALVPVKSAPIWAVALSCSINTIWNWLLQLRGDFPGIFFGLLGVRLLLWRSRWAAPLAGVCVGLAFQFKITFVAAGIAGVVWLATQREWKALGLYVLAAAVCAFGLYFGYWLREPAMIPHMLALSPGISDVHGAIKLAFQALSNVVVLLALLGLVGLLPRIDSRWTLLLLYAVIAFGVGGATAIQVGANSNYFYEGLLASVPVAVLGVQELLAYARHNAPIGIFLAAVLGMDLLAPKVIETRDQLVGEVPTAVRNEHFAALEQALRGASIFSTVPRIALIDSNPPLVEPYLLTYSTQMGKTNPAPLLDRLRRSEFDLVVTRADSGVYRTIAFVQPQVHAAIAAAYRPQCILEQVLVHLPSARHPDTDSLASRLDAIGCRKLPPDWQPHW